MHYVLLWSVKSKFKTKDDTSKPSFWYITCFLLNLGYQFDPDPIDYFGRC